MTRFYATNTDAPQSFWTTSNFNKRCLSTHSPDNLGAVHTVNVVALVTGDVTHTYWTDSEQPHNSVNWPTDFSYGYSFDVAVAGADLTYNFTVHRFKADGTGKAQSGGGIVTGTWSGTGIQVATAQQFSGVNTGTLSATDRLLVVTVCNNANMMTNQDFSIRYSDTDTWIECTSFTPPSSGTTLAPTAIASAEAHGSPTVSSAVTLGPTSIATGEAHGSPTVTQQQTLAPTAIASAQAMGTPIVSSVASMVPTAIASAGAFGTTALSSLASLVPTSIASAEAHGSPTLSNQQSLLPTAITSAGAFGTPVMSSVVSMATFGIASAEAFGTPVLVRIMAP
jgi:hypothetical protein